MLGGEPRVTAATAGAPGSELIRALSAPGVCRFLGVHDAVTARIGAEAGFQGLWLSGFCLATTLGLPDSEAVSDQLLLRACETVRDAVDLPLLVDGNAGFGDTSAVARLVTRLARGGIDGVALEDKRYPRSNSLLDDVAGGLEDPCEFAVKIAAARETAPSSLAVVARTEALVMGRSVDEALQRAAQYEAAGADALIVHSKDASPERVLAFANRWTGTVPLMVIPTTYPQLSIYAAAQSGIAGMIFANHLLRAGIRAMRALAAELYSCASPMEIGTPLASIRDMFDLQGIEASRRLVAHYAELRNVIARVGNGQQPGSPSRRTSG